MLTGLDRLLEAGGSDPEIAKIRGELKSAKGIALVAHPASVTSNLVHALEALSTIGIKPRVLFGPEHGWTGQAQDMIGVASSGVDDGSSPNMGVAVGGGGVGRASSPSFASYNRPRVISLYGETFDDLSPKPEDLEGIDVVLIDMQDVGARYYTFIWSAVLVARVCRDLGIRVIVLDRPNPIGGETVEGRLQDAAFQSFVGLERIPIRHGLTLGEIVKWRAKVEGYRELITNVGVTGLSDRGAHARSWKRAFVMPSPNMPTYDTALVYPGGCLLEGTNLSDGRGTTRPFELTGAPWIDGERLARELMGRFPNAGFIARPISFEPTFHKHAKKTCGGVQIHPTDVHVFRPVATYVALIALAQRMAPKDFEFRTERYEFVDTIPAFDLLTGSAEARERILAGESALEIANAVSRIGEEERAILRQARNA